MNVAPGVTEHVTGAELTMAAPTMTKPDHETFPRCPACDLPLFATKQAEEEHRAVCPGPQPKRRGRPRKYPVGYKACYRYAHDGARRGLTWWKEQLRQSVGEYGPLMHQGEPLFPLVAVAATLKKTPQAVYRLVRRHRLPYILAPAPRCKGLPCLKPQELRYLMDVVLFKQRNAK